MIVCLPQNSMNVQGTNVAKLKQKVGVSKQVNICIHVNVLPGCLMLAVGSLADGKVMNIIGMFPNTSSRLREKYRSILHM